MVLCFFCVSTHRVHSLKSVSGPCSVEIMYPCEWRIAIPASLMRVDQTDYAFAKPVCKCRVYWFCSALVAVRELVNKSAASAASLDSVKFQVVIKSAASAASLCGGRASGRLDHGLFFAIFGRASGQIFQKTFFSSFVWMAVKHQQWFRMVQT